MILNLLIMAVGNSQPLFCLINFILFYFVLFQIIIDIIVTDGIVTRSDVIDPFYLYCIIKMYGQMLLRSILFVIMVHALTEPSGY